MQRIELRHCDVSLKDGLKGTAAVNQGTTAPVSGDTTLTIDTVVLNTKIVTKVPIGARFTIVGETASTTHVVTARTLSDDVVTQITFTPALGAGTYADNAVITFSSQLLSVKIGDGDLKYSESSEYLYDKDRGLLDSVRDGDEVPMEVDLNFLWSTTVSGTGEAITPLEAIKQKGAASEWVGTGASCEPYAVDIQVVHTPPCGSAQKETYVFPAFRSEKRAPDFKSAAVAISGKCNVTEPVVTRG
jgi:hypothetical protein